MNTTPGTTSTVNGLGALFTKGFAVSVIAIFAVIQGAATGMLLWLSTKAPEGVLGTTVLWVLTGLSVVVLLFILVAFVVALCAKGDRGE